MGRNVCVTDDNNNYCSRSQSFRRIIPTCSMIKIENTIEDCTIQVKKMKLFNSDECYCKKLKSNFIVSSAEALHF